VYYHGTVIVNAIAFWCIYQDWNFQSLCQLLF